MRRSRNEGERPQGAWARSPPRASRNEAERPYGRARRLCREERGATITEYAILLFLVLVVAGAGWKVFGAKLNATMGRTTANLEASGDTTHQGGGGGAASGGAGASLGGGGAGGARSDTNDSFSGGRPAPKEAEGSPLPKLAMIAFGLLGAAAVFFTAMKGKNAR